MTKLISLFIYLAGLVVLIPPNLRYNLLNNSDLEREYTVYRELLQSGAWIPNLKDPYGYAGCTFLTTSVPAHLQLILPLPDDLYFRLIPSLFFAFMPVFTYLISRRYLSVGLAVLSALFVMTHFYFLIDPFLGRVMLGWAFLAMFLYGIVASKMCVMLVASVGLVLGHYGATLIGIAAGGSLLLFTLTKRQPDSKLAIALVFLVLISYVWYIQLTGFNYPNLALADYASGDPVMQSILPPGLQLPARPTIVDKVNTVLRVFSVSGGWFILGIMGLGIISSKGLPLNLRVLSVVAFVFVILGLVLPPLSSIYGIARVYYSGLPVLAGLFVFGASKITALVKLDHYWLIMPFLIFHSNFSPF